MFTLKKKKQIVFDIIIYNVLMFTKYIDGDYFIVEPFAGIKSTVIYNTYTQLWPVLGFVEIIHLKFIIKYIYELLQ